MAISRAHLPGLAIAATLGLAAGAMAVVLAGGNARQHGPGDDALAARVAELEAELARRPAALQPPAQVRPAAATAVAASGSRPPPAAGRAPAPQRTDVDQQLKELLTLAWNDRRSMREKLEDFVAAHPGSEGIAVASKGVFDLADNPQVLPDSALAQLYLEQSDPAFRRVLAQVASTRGDNSLIELHVAEAATGLQAPTPAERQQALVELARSRHASAADRVAPLLRDRDTGVVLDALLALRATGNQRHVRMVEMLAAHPDESVSWLARDVAGELRMLSEQARIRIDDRELAAELPPLPVADAGTVARCISSAG
ncbi:hypothetical protein ACFQ2D_07010 [Luteimonas composti]|uniref:hypothetical protein n=1 Tax=Luteimonas composti TaxID=398257 RepID=UPI003631507D